MKSDTHLSAAVKPQSKPSIRSVTDRSISRSLPSMSTRLFTLSRSRCRAILSNNISSSSPTTLSSTRPYISSPAAAAATLRPSRFRFSFSIYESTARQFSSKQGSTFESLSPSFGSDARLNLPPNVKMEDIMLDGCDFEHWLIMMEKPDGELSREDIIDSYIKTLAKIVGSEEEAKMKIYSVSTMHYYAFSCLLPEEVAKKLNGLPGVSWVLPDAYVDVKNKDYGGEPFINGEAVPYDPKYHEEWVRNNSRAKGKNSDRPKGGNKNRQPMSQNSGSKEKNAGLGSPDGRRAF